MKKLILMFLSFISTSVFSADFDNALCVEICGTGAKAIKGKNYKNQIIMRCVPKHLIKDFDITYEEWGTNRYCFLYQRNDYFALGGAK